MMMNGDDKWRLANDPASVQVLRKKRGPCATTARRSGRSRGTRTERSTPSLRKVTRRSPLRVLSTGGTTDLNGRRRRFIETARAVARSALREVGRDRGQLREAALKVSSYTSGSVMQRQPLPPR